MSVIQFTGSNRQTAAEEAKAIYESVESGETTGFACVRTTNKEELEVHVAGCHAKHPVYAIGALFVLIFKIMKMRKLF